MKKTKGLIEQHIHGAFGIDFMTCSVQEMTECAELLMQKGVCSFFPTIMTDNINVIKERIEIVKEAKSAQNKKTAKIEGIHLEGPFINPDKAGIHEKKYILPLDIELYKKIEDDIVKIITLAPELDTTGEFLKYLFSKNIKISAGHTKAYNLTNINQVTHLYNAMGAFHHRDDSTVVSALINNDIFVEIIGDSKHINDDVLKLTLEQKPLDKVLLISDALPLAHSDKSEMKFAGQTIFNKNGKLIGIDGTMAGSSSLLCDIVKNLTDKSILSFDKAILCASENIANYHNIQNETNIYWNDDNTIKEVKPD